MKKQNGASGVQDTLSSDEQSLRLPLKSHLDAEVEELDFNITSKLSAARHRALAGESSGSRSAGFGARLGWQGIAVGGCAAVLVTVLVVNLFPETTVPVATDVAVVEPSNIMEDLHLLSAADDIDFYQSVEFLEWMEMNSG